MNYSINSINNLVYFREQEIQLSERPKLNQKHNPKHNHFLKSDNYRFCYHYYKQKMWVTL